MKILICGDLHLRDTAPSSRVDDFSLAQALKVKFILETSKKYAALVVFPGDVFDSFRISHRLLANYSCLFSSCSYLKFSVYGQHDMRYHSLDFSNTPLNVMAKSNMVIVLGKSPFRTSNGVDFYGASWGEEIPKIRDEKKFNVLVIHKMIVSEKIWEGQENFEYAGKFLRSLKYDLIISGDNHKTIIQEERGGRFLFNMGSVMRMGIDQIDFEPSIAIFDTESRTYEKINLPISPGIDVFDMGVVDERKKNKELESFVSGLKNPDKIDFDFVANLKRKMEEDDIPLSVKLIIGESLERISK